MKSKIIIISIILVWSLLLISCNKDTTTEIPSIRTYSEYNNLSEEDKVNLISEFDKLSVKKIEEELLKMTKEYLLENEIIEYEIKNVEFTKNDLLLATGENRKIRCNGNVLVEFSLKENCRKVSKADAEKFLQEFFRDLYDDILVSSQVMSIELWIWENEKSVFTSYGGGEIDIAFAPFIEQDVNEYKTQTLVYELAQNAIYLSLRKFGHINGNELYIEYSVDDNYFLQNDASELKNVCTNVTALLLSDEEAMKFLEENNTCKIILSFSNYKFLNENNIEYSLDL